MRTIAIAAVSAVLLSSVSVYAQTPSSATTPGARPPGAAAPAAAAPRPTPNPLKQEMVSNIEGTTVNGKDDSKIGHISEVLMDPDNKKIDRLVVKTGGVLGMGGHQFALPVDQFTWEADKGVLKVSMDEAAAKSQPEWVEGANNSGTGSSTPPAGAVPPTHAGDSAPAH
jgi:sporulation protein YlmC with PRC-barrel domain